MVPELLLIKLIVSVCFVLVLSIIAERSGPRVAGLISGYPTGTAITLFFIGLEISPQFAAESAVFNMAGLVAMQAFLYSYYRASMRLGKRGVILSLLSGIAGYLIVAYALFLLQPGEIAAAVITLASIPFFIYLFRNIKDSGKAEGASLGPGILLARAAVAAAVIIAVTEAAGYVGPQWAGLLSAFPTTVAPLLVIVHSAYGEKQAHIVIKNVPYGLGSVIMYSLCVSFAYPAFGVYFGTIIAYAAASAYLAVYLLLISRGRVL